MPQWTHMVLIALLVSSMATAQNTFTVDRDSADLRLIDTSNGSTITTTPLIGTSGSLTALSVDPTSGIFYAIDGGGSTARSLITLNPMTGATTLVGPVANAMSGMSFDANGTLYGIAGEQGVAGGLYTINKTTGVSTLVASLGNPGADGDEIAVSPFDGLIYRVDNEEFSTIDPNAGFAQTFITTLGANGISEVTGIGFDAGGDLLMIDLGDDIFSVTTTGVETLIGPVGHQGHGIDQPGLFGPPVLPNFPGTGEDLITTASLNSGSFSTVSSALNDTLGLVAGDTIAVRHSSPNGTFDFIEVAVFGTAAPNGTASTEVFPGLHLLNGGVLFSAVAGNFNGQPLLMVPGGVSWGAVHPGGALVGTSILVQAASLTATAANNIFASTNGLLVQFN